MGKSNTRPNTNSKSLRFDCASDDDGAEAKAYSRQSKGSAVNRCLTYLEGAAQLDVHRLVLLLAWRRDLDGASGHTRITRRSYVVFLIDERLIDLESLHLCHCLRVALLLSLLGALLLPHRSDLLLQIHAVAVHFGQS